MKTVYMGLFGMTENEKLASYLYSLTNNGKLKSFWQEGGWNISLVEKLVNSYNTFRAQGMIGDTLAANIQIQTAIPRDIITAYITYRGAGNIPLQKSSIESIVKSVIDPALKTLNVLPAAIPLALTAAIVLGGAFILSQMKGVSYGKKKVIG